MRKVIRAKTPNFIGYEFLNLKKALDKASKNLQLRTPEALDYYYLKWNISYSAGEALPIFIVINPNGKTPPSQVSLSLYDEFNNIKLIDIADTPLTSSEIAIPFPVYTWTVVSEIKSDFNFESGDFTMVMSYNDGNTTVKKDRRLKLLNVVASPG
ncbi:13974_t:CDS:2, partial [Racocetra fulgida]